jgi:hypothetical protein
VTPNTSAWQNTAYAGGFSPVANRGGEKQKKGPFVSVDEAVTPATTYVSIGEDYGMPITGIGEPTNREMK